MKQRRRIHLIQTVTPFANHVTTACGIESAGGGSASKIGGTLAYLRKPATEMHFFLATITPTLVSCMNCRRKAPAAFAARRN
jgi:hypothetical protein